MQARWGIVATAVVMFLITILFGGKGSIYSFVWLMMGYYGYKGELGKIREWMKWLIFINIGVLVVVMLFVSDQTASYIHNSDGKLDLVFGVLIMLMPKIGLYFYTNSEIKRGNPVSYAPNKLSNAFSLRGNAVNLTSGTNRSENISNGVIALLVILAAFLAVAYLFSGSYKSISFGSNQSEQVTNSKARNSEWIFFDNSNKDNTKINYFYDLNNVTKTPDSNYLVNVAYVFDGYVYVADFDGKDSIGNVRYAKRLIEFDCKEYKTRKIKSDLYGSELADANQLRLNATTRQDNGEFESGDLAGKLCPVLLKIN